MFRKALFVATLIGLGLSGSLHALQAQEPLKRTVLQRVDVPGSNQEVVLVLVDFATGASVGRHTHPGPELATVAQGEITLMVEGQPARTFKVGESFQVSGGTIHDAKSGAGAAKVIVAYVIPKGQPLAAPAK